MKQTALYDVHIALGARMVPFAGWEMPVQYPAGPIREHETVRNAAGLFDIDHMGQFIVSGPDALEFLQYVSTNDASVLNLWESQYSLLCYADGGVVDDIFIYRRADDYFVVVNASNRDKDLKWLNAHTPGFEVSIEDVSDATYMLAFQGPKAQAVLQHVCELDLGTIPFHHGAHARVAGVEVFVGNTGYTGEYGYELFFDTARAPEVWNAILGAGEPEGVLPIGLAARDSLRFEPCLPLYGHEITASISPVEAGLGFAVSGEKGDYIGKDALLKQKLEGAPRRLACLEMIDRAVPREHYEVVVDGEKGFVTTGMLAPTGGIYAAMALIPRALYELGKEVDVMVRGVPKKAKIVRRPFYTPAYRRS
ncbi:MAG: glycine cleavage system aminomethyltransferase GcvT [Anaerolineae bacterium]|nr:glycine cleavage system aminomethyltransferase GcvT [Anaerolineae bacterium]